MQGQKFDLPYILQSVDPQAPYDERLEWVVQLCDWIRHRSWTELNTDRRAVLTRIRFLLQLLDRNPAWKAKSALAIRSVLTDTRSLRTFTELGLPTESTFAREILRRLFHVLLPHALEDKSLEGIFLNVFYDPEDPKWVEELTADLRSEIVSWVRTGLPENQVLTPHWIVQAAEAQVVLSTRIAGICFLEEIRSRAPEFPIETHPALKLQTLTRAFHESVIHKRAWIASDLEAFRRDFNGHLTSVRALMLSVRSHMEEQGVSVNLVYQVDRVKLSLERIELLSRWVVSAAASLYERPANALSAAPAAEIIRTLAWGSVYDSDFRFVLTKGASLLSRKIVERTGESGEHFITQNRAEWRKMFALAAGGGALTAGTAFFKYIVDASRWPPFLEIVYHATNYGASFLIMHYAGFKLATKQPSMTAATLAGRLKDGDESVADEVFVDEIAQVSRSQFAAVMGNVLMVIPVAYVMDLTWQFLRKGKHFLPADQAAYVIHSVHPWQTLTLIYAAWTGVLLWISSMIAGWCENAVVFFELPRVVRQQRRLRKILGDRRLESMAAGLVKHTSGIAGAVSLGVLLAVSPAVGSFFGLPFDVRHVTLTSGALTFAWASTGLQGGGVFAMSLLSVAIIALLNFGVSFALAAMVAFRAHEVSFDRFRLILRLARRKFFSNPKAFFIPGKHET